MKTIKALVPVSTLLALLTSQGQAAAPQNEGRWGAEFPIPLPQNRPLLTPQGRVITLGFREISIWNPEAGTGANARNTFEPDNPIGSLATGSTVFLPNTGNILITGDGTMNDAAIFNPQTNRRETIADVNFNNALPELSTLPNGSIYVSGSFRSKIYSPTANAWRSLTGVSNLRLDSQNWLAPNGKIFTPGGVSPESLYYIDTTGNGESTAFAGSIGGKILPPVSVMYQPGKLYYPDGGVSADNLGPVRVDITTPTPLLISVTDSRGYEAANAGDAIMLPNGKVMNIVNPSNVSERSDELEIWNPNTLSWSLMSSVRESSPTGISFLRLLKDGRVFANVSNNPFSQSNPPETETVGRIFTPPYLFNSSGQLAQRPTITSAPAKGTYGNRVQVNHGTSDVITRVTLLKIDEQRFQELAFDDFSGNVSVKLPSSPNVTPPGYYLMYLLNDKGVPSKGHIINITAQSQNAGAYPTATADIVTATGGSLITIDALANDRGTGLVLNKPNAWSQKGGNVALVNNKITYKPKVGFNGVDKIWYVFRDAQGRTNNGVITITVSGNSSNNSPYPVAKQDYVTTTTGTKTTINVLANDTGSGLVLNAPNVWSLSGGRVALVNNQLVYTSRTGFTGSDKIWYTFKDNQGRSNSGQVNITVKSASSTAFPVAKADYYITTKNTGKVLDILANDITSGGIAIDTLYSYTAKGGWTNKTTNGKVWYKPKTGFTGEDNFWYVMIDAQGRKNSAQVKINVK